MRRTNNIKIIDALEAIPAEERTPEMDRSWPAPITIWQTHISQLAKKCSKGPRSAKPHEEYFEDDYYWNFRMGYPIIIWIKRAGPADTLKRHGGPPW